MSDRSLVTCAAFDDEADELAVGAVSEPRRSALLAHADGCASCGAHLRELADVADRLLLLAPPAEPPAGFESRAIARIGARIGGSWGRRHRGRWLAGVAAVVVALLVGAAIGRADGGSDRGREATISASDGAVVGHAELVADPAPHVLLSIDHPRSAPGTRSCQLVLANGRRVTVGSWTYDDIEGGVWAAGVARELLDAASMRIVDDDGRVLATARFD